MVSPHFVKNVAKTKDAKLPNYKIYRMHSDGTEKISPDFNTRIHKKGQRMTAVFVSFPCTPFALLKKLESKSKKFTAAATTFISNSVATM